ncbi:replication initiation protein [Eubacterium sp.]|uniref:replication initiation protein n=1 Tax=Eubacterium sp. TaxID=142586 RepID=UPI0025BA73C6|nr:replication initiation protein [Eubacterium sp.]
MTEEYIFPDEDLHEQIIAMDNTLARKSTKFTVDEQRLFYITLASIKPDQKGNEIEIDKKAMIDMLGFESQNVYSRIRGMFKKLAMASWIEFGDDEIFDDGFLISAIRTTKRKVYVTIADKYIPLLIELAPGFTRLLSDDAISFKSKFSMLLYQQLMRWSHKGVFGATTKELKELFGMTKDDYVYKGAFNRALFERKSIDVAVQDINEKSKCINNLRYEKKKKGNRVQGYVFFFDYTDPNNFRKTYNLPEQLSLEDIAVDTAELNSLLNDLKEGKL